MGKIEKLTPEQETYLIDYRQRWLDIGLCCEPADFDKAKQHITFFYEKLGKQAPMFFCFSSPMMCELGLAALKVILNKGQLWGQLRGQLRDQLRDQLGGQLGGQLRDQLWGQLENPEFVHTNFWGQQDAYWVAFYKFCNEIGVKYKDDNLELLNAWGAIAESACWWSPWEGVCIISDRPRKVRFQDGLLHCENGKAVEFSDGWGLYAWRGVNIPAEWIEEKSSVTPKIALTWKNIEQRRCAAEIIGWAKALRDPSLKPVTIHKDDDPQIGELIEVELPDIGRERFLFVQCGTQREFALPVPPDMQTALQANAWTYGLDEKSYTPEVRT